MNDLFTDIPLRSLTDVDRLLVQADNTLTNGSRSAVIIGIAHMRILHAGFGLGFRYLEERYRFLASRTYLLAAPLSKKPADVKAVMVPTAQRAKHFIWICVNGPEEADQYMRDFGIIDASDNMNRLKATGLLMR